MYWLLNSYEQAESGNAHKWQYVAIQTNGLNGLHEMDRHSVKLSRLLAFDCAGIAGDGSLLRNLTLVSYWASTICIVLLTCALSGSLWADTPSYRNVLYPRGAVQLLETMAIALDRRLVRLCGHLSKNMNCEAER